MVAFGESQLFCGFAIAPARGAQTNRVTQSNADLKDPSAEVRLKVIETPREAKACDSASAFADEYDRSGTIDAVQFRHAGRDGHCVRLRFAAKSIFSAGCLYVLFVGIGLLSSVEDCAKRIKDGTAELISSYGTHLGTETETPER
jgi:hypothetical protein